MPLAVALPALPALLHLVISAGPTVKAGFDEAPCPGPDDVRRSVSRQLGDSGAMNGWTIRYATAGRGVLSVEVVDAAGALRAQRRIAVERGEAGGCAAAAETVAAIGVRAFQPIGWAAAPADVGPAAEIEAPVAPMPAAALPPRFALAVGPALVSAPSANGNVLLDASVRLGSTVRARAGGFLLPMHQTEAAGRAGRASLTRVQTFAALTWTTRAGKRELDLGPVLGVGIDRGRTESVSAPSAGVRSVWTGGAFAAATWVLTARWRVGVVGVLWAGRQAADFSVKTDAGERTALRGPLILGFCALRAEGAIFP